MLSRKVDWITLSQCDLDAVKRTIEKFCRSAECIVRPLSERLFDQNILTKVFWKETYEIFCKSYETLKPSFKIDCDSCNGYRLIYVGDVDLQARLTRGSCQSTLNSSRFSSKWIRSYNQ